MPDLTGLESMRLISLSEVLAAAPATTRVDRKYLVPTELGEEFLARLPATLRLLSINDRLTTSYRSTYFDTADLLTCRAHVQGRRRRWKARSRLYVEDGLCRLELKVRDGSGSTRKFFHPTEPNTYGQMNGVAAAFFHRQLLAHGHTEAVVLEPAVEVCYERATLADPETGTRVTIDSEIRATRHDQSVEVDPGHLIVETKGGRAPGVADQLLKQLGARPISFSKYAASASLMDVRIADNDVRHLLGRQLQLTRGSNPAAPNQTSQPPPTCAPPILPTNPPENRMKPPDPPSTTRPRRSRITQNRRFIVVAVLAVVAIILGLAGPTAWAKVTGSPASDLSAKDRIGADPPPPLFPLPGSPTLPPTSQLSRSRPRPSSATG